jgi:chaperonin cofactor prefoldin
MSSTRIQRSFEEIGYLAGKASDAVSAVACFDLQAQASHYPPKICCGLTSVLASAMSHSISIPGATISMLMEIPSVVATVFTSDMSWATSWSPNRNLELLSGALSAGVNPLENAVTYGENILGGVYKEIDPTKEAENKNESKELKDLKDLKDLNTFAKNTGFLLFSCKDGKFDAKDGLMKYGEKLDKDIKTLEKRKKCLNKNTDNYEEESKRLGDKLLGLKEKECSCISIKSNTKGLDLYASAVNDRSHLVKNESAKKCLEEQMKANFLASPGDTGNFFASFIVDMTKRKIKSRDKSAKQDNGSERGVNAIKLK